MLLRGDRSGSNIVSTCLLLGSTSQKGEEGCQQEQGCGKDGENRQREDESDGGNEQEECC